MGPEEVVEFKWTVNHTKMLIDLYRKYHKMVGSFQVRNKKQMWQIISAELGRELDITITPSNCENRWKVLDRNYKKYIDHQNSTGRGRKIFEFSEEMAVLYGNKTSVRPELLLATDTQHTPGNTADDSQLTDPEQPKVPNGVEENETNIQGKKGNKRKITTLENIRNDRRAYQEKRLKIEMEKLEVMKKRNELIEERNKILREGNCCKCRPNLIDSFVFFVQLYFCKTITVIAYLYYFFYSQSFCTVNTVSLFPVSIYVCQITYLLQAF